MSTATETRTEADLAHDPAVIAPFGMGMALAVGILAGFYIDDLYVAFQLPLSPVTVVWAIAVAYGGFAMTIVYLAEHQPSLLLDALEEE